MINYPKAFAGRHEHSSSFMHSEELQLEMKQSQTLRVYTKMLRDVK